ncbi:MAG: hypothetical protein HY247_02040 [archaeon]|nr:MAG: hypothetical protein HY247_02040 [archaeon]
MNARPLPAIAIALLFLVPLAPAAGTPTGVSYNPGAASVYHAPLSQMGIVAVARSHVAGESLVYPTGSSNLASSLSVPVSLTRFINDSSYTPQSETTLALDPSNASHIVGGFNDGRYFFCPSLRFADCPDGYTKSVSGFTTSADGGSTLLKSDDIPGISVTEKNLTSSISGPGFLVSWGDPSLAAGPGGVFYYGSLAIDPDSGANGVMLAKSNSNLWDPSNSCATHLATPSTNSCWSTKLIYANLTYQCPATGICGTTSFEDKDAIAVDLDQASPFFGSVYVAWNHFFSDGRSGSYLARCTPSLSCTMLSGGASPLVSGPDPYADFATPVVATDGTVYVAWCNFGTASTFGPVDCQSRLSAAGGASFGTVHPIMSFMGVGSDLPGYSAIVGFATEQFRASSEFSLAPDSSGSPSTLYFAIPLCVSGAFYDFQDVLLPSDNPGNCGASEVFFMTSTDRGADWSSPSSISDRAVVIQPSISVDPDTGAVAVAYYTTKFDPFDHRVDVVVSVSKDGGQNFAELRLTPVSDEPDSDPSLFNYARTFGGALVVPQFGDYMTAAAGQGRVYVLFTGNYKSEGGTLQADPYLGWVPESPPELTLGPAAADAAPGDVVPYSVLGLDPGSAFGLSLDWSGVQVVLANGTVGPTGAVAGNFSVPNLQSRVYTVVAKDAKGTYATANLAVGQVSVSGILAALQGLSLAVASLNQSVTGAQAALSSQISALGTSVGDLQASVTDELAAFNSSLLTSFAAVDSQISRAISGPASTLNLIAVMLVISVVLLLATLYLLLTSRRKEGRENPAVPSASPPPVGAA